MGSGPELDAPALGENVDARLLLDRPGHAGIETKRCILEVMEGLRTT
jgi:hypothetical protein